MPDQDTAAIDAFVAANAFDKALAYVQDKFAEDKDKYTCLVNAVTNQLKTGKAVKKNYFDLWEQVSQLKQYYEIAVLVFTAANQQFPNDFDLLFRLAFAESEMNDYQAAIGHYKQCLAIKKDDQATLINLGYTSQQNKDIQPSIDYYKQVLDLNPSYELAYKNLQNVCYINKQLPQYIDACKKIILRQGTLHTGVLADFVFYSEVLQQLDGAIRFLEVYVQQNRKDAEAAKQLAIAYLVSQRHYDALTLYTQLNPKENNAEYFYLAGNIYLDKLDYAAATVSFNKALALDPDYLFAKHNLAYIKERQGDFEQSKPAFLELAKAYLGKMTEPMPDAKKADYAFYRGDILFVYEAGNQLHKAREAYETALALIPDDIRSLLALAKYHTQEKQQLNEEKYIDEKDAYKVYQRFNIAHMNLMSRCFNGIQLLQIRMAAYPSKYDYCDLGEFYLYAELYEKGKQSFETCIQLFPSFVRGHMGAGVACMKMNDYKEAIPFFKTALTMDPADFNTRSNLAEAYLKSERYSDAEKEYREILNFCPTYLDALLGLAEYLKIMGDKAVEDNSVNDAEDWYQKAKKRYEQLLDINTKGIMSSRRFNRADLNNIYYSLGYIKVKLYELGSKVISKNLLNFKTVRFSSLQSARNDFNQIKPGEDNYFKSRNAIRKINNEQSIKTSFTKTWAPAIIISASVLILLLAQYSFFVGMKQQKNNYYIDQQQLLAAVKPGTLNQKDSATINKAAAITFDSRQSAIAALAGIREVPPAQVTKALLELPAGDTINKISETGYGFLTFSSLIFIIIGFFLSQISKLKVGSIELEKSVLDTSSTSSSLGIKK